MFAPARACDKVCSMGMYEARRSAHPGIGQVAKAKRYTLYRRANGIWYVHFMCGGKSARYSTGLTAHDQARELVEAHRPAIPLAGREVNATHLARMIERARARCQKKGLPFALSMAIMRELAGRCGGLCEVSGHPLEDSGPFRPSLDRIDPSLGYVPGNVRIVCLIANTAMLHYGEAAFLDLARALCAKIDASKVEPVY